MPAAAVLFDMDGLLVDSEPVWTVAEEELAERLGGTWSTALKAAIVGTRIDVAVPRILEWYGLPATPDRVAETGAFLVGRMAELLRQSLPVHAGALELLDALGDRNVPTGLVSSSYRVLVDAVLDVLGRDRFRVTVSGDEVTHGKPHPEPYLTACRRLGVDPAAVVVLEDAPSGVASAEAAGCTVVAVPDVTPVPETPRRPVVATLAGVDPGWLLGLAPARGAGA